jgi:hypothetical protein
MKVERITGGMIFVGRKRYAEVSVSLRDTSAVRLLPSIEVCRGRIVLAFACFWLAIAFGRRYDARKKSRKI